MTMPKHFKTNLYKIHEAHLDEKTTLNHGVVHLLIID